MASHGEWLTPEQAAAYLRVTRSTIYRWSDEGRLAFSALESGRGRRYQRQELDRFLGEQAQAVARRAFGTSDYLQSAPRHQQLAATFRRISDELSEIEEPLQSVLGDFMTGWEGQVFGVEYWQQVRENAGKQAEAHQEVASVFARNASGPMIEQLFSSAMLGAQQLGHNMRTQAADGRTTAYARCEACGAEITVGYPVEGGKPALVVAGAATTPCPHIGIFEVAVDVMLHSWVMPQQFPSDWKDRLASSLSTMHGTIWQRRPGLVSRDDLSIRVSLDTPGRGPEDASSAAESMVRRHLAQAGLADSQYVLRVLLPPPSTERLPGVETSGAQALNTLEAAEAAYVGTALGRRPLATISAGDPKVEIAAELTRVFQSEPIPPLEIEGLIALLDLYRREPWTQDPPLEIEKLPKTGPDGSALYSMNLKPLAAYTVNADKRESTLEHIRTQVLTYLIPRMRSWEKWHESQNR